MAFLRKLKKANKTLVSIDGLDKYTQYTRVLVVSIELGTLVFSGQTELRFENRAFKAETRVFEFTVDAQITG